MSDACSRLREINRELGRQFPLSGVWAIGILLGIKLLFGGMIMVAAGSTVRAARGAVDAAEAR